MTKLCCVLAALVAAVAMATAALAAPSPRAVRASIIDAALAQKSVRWTESLSLDLVVGGAVWRANVSADSGVERLSTDMPGWSGGKARLRLVDGVVYVRGNPAGLRYALDLTKAQAKKYAWQWISIPKGDKLYGLSRGLKLASLVHDEMPPRRGSKLKVAHGTRLLDVQWTQTGPIPSGCDLKARASGSPLPVTVLCGGQGDSDSGRFSKWNEPVRVAAPASSTPIATVRGS